MLKFENSSVYVLDNITDEIIYESDNENIVTTIKTVLKYQDLATTYFELSEKFRAEKDYYEAKKCERYFSEHYTLAKQTLKTFNLLIGTDIKLYQIFTLA